MTSHLEHIVQTSILRIQDLEAKQELVEQSVNQLSILVDTFMRIITATFEDAKSKDTLR